MNQAEAVRLISEIVGRPLELQRDSSLRLVQDLGLDSLGQAELLAEYEEQMEYPSADLLDSIDTVADAVHFLSSRG